MEIGEIVVALQNVPETHLKIVDLPWRFLDEKGNLDDKKIAFEFDEVQAAIDEARTYIAGNSQLLYLLRELTGRRFE